MKNFWLAVEYGFQECISQDNEEDIILSCCKGTQFHTVHFFHDLIPGTELNVPMRKKLIFISL